MEFFIRSLGPVKCINRGSGLTGDVKITLASKVINNALLYDEAGHRFAFYYNKK